ncbi:hypothetical protein V6N11_032584 [Hibiscus sabdariffa]|uniref:GDSL esterase/lipase n=1 Tax=Hibiscus sabdariffa TaxID=183260 RepID=A0ABR2T123_9ROSI
MLEVASMLKDLNPHQKRWSRRAAPPLAVTVFFGANDACLPDGYAGFQHCYNLDGIKIEKKDSRKDGSCINGSAANFSLMDYASPFA